VTRKCRCFPIPRTPRPPPQQSGLRGMVLDGDDDDANEADVEDAEEMLEASNQHEDTKMLDNSSPSVSESNDSHANSDRQSTDRIGSQSLFPPVPPTDTAESSYAARRAEYESIYLAVMDIGPDLPL